jgi:hypothetical protein
MCAASPWRDAVRKVFAVNYNAIHAGIAGFVPLLESSGKSAHGVSGASPQTGSTELTEPAPTAATELKARLAWMISYGIQLLVSIFAIGATLWIITVGIGDNTFAIGYQGISSSRLRYSVFVFGFVTIAVWIILYFAFYGLVHGLFRGHLRHAPLGSLFVGQDNLLFFVEERLLPGIRRLLRLSNRGLDLAVIGLIAAVSVTLLELPNMRERRDLGNDVPYEQYLTRCFQRLTLAIYVGAVLLAVSVAQVDARHFWPLSLAPDSSSTALKGAASELSFMYGTFFTLFLVALYSPAVIILRRRAWSLVRASAPTLGLDEQKTWLTHRNLSFTLSQKVAQLLSLLAPAGVAAATPLLNLLL